MVRTVAVRLSEREFGADLWALGRWWGDQVAAKWEATVQASLDRSTAEAERPSR